MIMKASHGQFQRNGHDIQTVFCNSKHRTVELAVSKQFLLSLSDTFKYQWHIHIKFYTILLNGFRENALVVSVTDMTQNGQGILTCC